MPDLHRVYLVPGFFGFAALGDLKYFGHVHDHLSRVLADEGVLAQVHTVPTRPTASLRRRALTLFETMRETAGPDDVLHLVGHSSGGLDARLLVTPGAVLPEELDPEPLAERVRSVVTVVSPNRGTPSASFFSTLYGKQVLRVLSIATLYTVRWGRLPLDVALRLGDLFVRAEGRLGAPPDAIDEVFANLLREFSDERRQAVQAFFSEVGVDQALVTQITPDAMDVFNATTPNRPGVRYGSVVARARRPGVRATLQAGVSPQAQAMNAVYTACWTLASQLGLDHAASPDALTYDPPAGLRHNDGMVPTLSQPWGTLIRAVQADHLDVIGHFSDPEHDPPHFDWIPTGSGFRREHFEAVWTDVAHFLLGHDPVRV